MPTVETLAEVGEFPLISRLTQGLATSAALLVGPGDDAAVCRLDGDSVYTVDLLVEGVHFRPDWSSAYDIGRKAVAVSVTDVEAMGATPVVLLAGLAAPAGLDSAWLVELMAGLKAEAARAQVVLAGGDLSAGRDITLAMTVVGQLAGRSPVLRSGAQVGDIVAYRGQLGLAAAGLALHQRGFTQVAVPGLDPGRRFDGGADGVPLAQIAPDLLQAAVQAFHCPLPPYGAGIQAAAAGATAMIDISDGLLADLGHIAELSGVVIDLDSAALVVDPAVQEVARLLDTPTLAEWREHLCSLPKPRKVLTSETRSTEALDYVLAGGEDQALAACFPDGPLQAGWTAIGRVTATTEAAVLVDGQPWTTSPGWRHFS